jgi:hypothetical protein
VLQIPDGIVAVQRTGNPGHFRAFPQPVAQHVGCGQTTQMRRRVVQLMLVPQQTSGACRSPCAPKRATLWSTEQYAVHDAAREQREGPRDDEGTCKQSDHGPAMGVDVMPVGGKDGERRENQHDDGQDVDGTEAAPWALAVDGKGANGDHEHQADPEIA